MIFTSQKLGLARFSFKEEKQICKQTPPTIPRRLMAESSYKDADGCKSVFSNASILSAHRVSADNAFEGDKCGMFTFDEGDGQADSYCLVDGKVDSLRFGGVLLEEGEAYCKMYQGQNSKHEYPRAKTIGRYTRVTPLAPQLVEENGNQLPRMEYKIDIVDGKDRAMVTQVHVFNGHVRIELRDKNGSITRQFEMKGGEQIRANDNGELLMKYSFNSGKYGLDSDPARKTSSCEIVPGEYPDSSPSVPNVPLDAIILAGLLSGLAFRRQISKVLSPVLELGSNAYEGIGSAMAQTRDLIRKYLK